MILVDRHDGAARPFEGDRTLRLLSLPANARVLRATARVEPAAAPGGEERVSLAPDRANAWGITVVQAGGWVEVDLHGRRTITGVVGSGLQSAQVLVDPGAGIFVPLAATGALGVTPPGAAFTLTSASGGDLPGVTVSRLRIGGATGGAPSIAEVRLRAAPANVSLRLGALAPFWVRPGDLAGAETTPDFGPVLQAYLDTRGEAEGGWFAIPLTVHSDGIARLRVAVEVEYRLEAALVPPSLPAVALPFDVGSVARAGGAGQPVGTGGALYVSLPPGARVSPGDRPPRVRGTFTDTRVVCDRGYLGPLDEKETARARVGGAFSQAQRVPPGVAATVAAVDLLLQPVTRGSRMQLDLRADHDGKPDPASLLRAPVPFPVEPGADPGVPAWTSVRLPAEVRVEADQPCWVVLQALEGEAEWVGFRWGTETAERVIPGGGFRWPGEDPPPLQHTADGGLSWHSSGPLTALFRLRDHPRAFTLPVQLQVGDEPGARRVRLDRLAALGRVDFALDLPELADALTAAAGAAPGSAHAHEALDNGAFRRWVRIGSAPGRPTRVDSVAGPVLAVAPAPDGARVYAWAGEGAEPVLYVVDTATDEVAAVLPVPRTAARVAGSAWLFVHPDGGTAYLLGRTSASQLTFAALSTVDGRELAAGSLEGSEGVTDVALSPDGGTLWAVGKDTLWAYDTAASSTRVPARSRVLDVADLACVAAAPDGTALYVGGRGTGGEPVLRALDPASLSPLRPPLVLRAIPHRAVLAPTGDRLLLLPPFDRDATDSVLESVDSSRWSTAARPVAGALVAAALEGGAAYLLATHGRQWAVDALDAAGKLSASSPARGGGLGTVMTGTPRGDRLYLASQGLETNSGPALWAVPLGARLPAAWTPTQPAHLTVHRTTGDPVVVLGEVEEEDGDASVAALSQVAAVHPSTRYTLSFRAAATEGALARAELFWRDAAGALLRAEEPLPVSGFIVPGEDAPPLLPHQRAWDSPAAAAQAEVRFTVAGGEATVAAVSLASRTGALADPELRLDDGGAGWSFVPAAGRGGAVRAEDGALSLRNATAAPLVLMQAAEVATGAVEVGVDGSASTLRDGSEAPALEVEWTRADGTAVGERTVLRLLPDDFAWHRRTVAPPEEAMGARVRLSVPPGAALQVREVTFRPRGDLAVPVRFLAEAPGDLVLTPGAVVYDAGLAAPPAVPAVGLARPTPPGADPAHPSDGCCPPDDFGEAPAAEHVLVPSTGYVRLPARPAPSLPAAPGGGPPEAQPAATGPGAQLSAPLPDARLVPDPEPSPVGETDQPAPITFASAASPRTDAPAVPPAARPRPKSAPTGPAAFTGAGGTAEVELPTASVPRTNLPLTEVRGIGEARATMLADSGIPSVAVLAGVRVDAVARMLKVGGRTAAAIIEDANRLLTRPDEPDKNVSRTESP